MREEFEKLVMAGKIGRQHVEALVQLAEAGFCMHKGWGLGKITTVDTVFARFSIDFDQKPGHSMDLSFAAESLKAIPSHHILARKLLDLQGLRQTAALHHLDLIKVVLQSFDGKATLNQIQEVLVPDVIQEDWKKWWEVARKEMKKDGHYKVPLKKTEPIIYQEKDVSLQDQLLQEFRAAKGLKARLLVVGELLKSLEDCEAPKVIAGEVVGVLNEELAVHLKNFPGLTLEAIFLRDDVARLADLPKVEGQLEESDVWQYQGKLSAILEETPAVKHKRVLQAYKQAFPETWVQEVLGIINEVPAKLCGECTHLLIHEGHQEEVKDLFRRLISHHQAGSEMLLWFAKDRSDSFADIFGPEVFRAMLTAIDRDQFNEKKSNRLRDFIVDDQSLLVDLIGSADIEVIKDLTHALKLSPIFEDMDKRSLLARIVKSYPSIQALISGDQNKHENFLVVSWSSLERRKIEYDELVNKKIPANSKEIAIARSYGDLRENHEYKSAKEMQKILLRRKVELEADLARARGTDYSNPRTDQVSIGTTLNLTDLDTGKNERYTIVGAWDADPDKNIISYLTPFGQALLNQKVGAEVAFGLDSMRRRFRVESVEPYAVQAEAKEGGVSKSEEAEV